MNKVVSFFLLISLVFSFNLIAQTNVGGVISTNSVWVVSGSPYIVTQPILVDSVATLTVEPGVDVLFQNNMWMFVYGALRAIGTPTDSILFTGQGGANWDGLTFYNSCQPYDTSNGTGTKLAYCNLIGTDFAPWQMITSKGCALEISNSRIFARYNIVSEGEINIRIVNNLISQSTWSSAAIKLGQGPYYGGTAVIIGNEISKTNLIQLYRPVVFENNYLHDFSDGGANAGLVLGALGTDTSTYIVCNNTFKNFMGRTLVIDNSPQKEDTVIIQYNHFLNNGKNLQLYCDSSGPNVHIINNNFHSYNDYNVYVDGGGSCGLPVGNYNTIDLSNNFWNNLTPSQMDSSIWDYNDNWTIGGLVNYQPILTSQTNGGNCSGLGVPCPPPLALFGYSDSLFTVSFTDLSLNGDSWLWNFGDGDTSILQNPVHTYNDTGWYYVCLIITDSCGSDTICDSIYVSEGVGVKQLTNYNNQITIYPNPTTGQFTISSRQGAIKKVEVYDLFGRLVLRTNKPEIDMRGYAKGVYVVKAGQTVRKLILH